MRQAALVALAALAATTFGSGRLAAQDEPAEIEIAASELAKVVTPGCTGGVVYDDGSLGAGYALGAQSAAAMRFDLPAGTTSLDQACVCLVRDAGAPASMSFDLIVYDNDGAGGSPGTRLIETPLTIDGISTTPSFFSFNLTSLSIPVADGSVFVGIRWPASYFGGNIYICGDTSAGLTQRTNFFSANNGTTWGTHATFFPANPGNNPRALGIRVDPEVQATPCVPNADTMCLNSNRYRVTATFSTAGSPISPAHAVKYNDDSGYFWFFNSNNTEVVVKVLNGCGVNNRYWVFSSGLTNVEVTLTVTDSANPGVVKTYHNPLNQNYLPIFDTNAFATCP